ncbi:hypothetical protein AAVH_19710 [Aphelenchoides avenae]|nr:hypothetical protein AAVH_19710 [Aphelenchus avenae]
MRVILLVVVALLAYDASSAISSTIRIAEYDGDSQEDSFEDDKHVRVVSELRWDRTEEDPNNCTERCDAVYDAEEYLRFCQERSYECRPFEKEMSAEEWIKALWETAKELNGRSLTYMLYPHGHHDDQTELGNAALQEGIALGTDKAMHSPRSSTVPI